MYLAMYIYLAKLNGNGQVHNFKIGPNSQKRWLEVKTDMQSYNVFYVFS